MRRPQTWTVTCPDCGWTTTTYHHDEADTLAATHDAHAHRSTPTTRIEAHP